MRAGEQVKLANELAIVKQEINANQGPGRQSIKKQSHSLNLDFPLRRSIENVGLVLQLQLYVVKLRHLLDTVRKAQKELGSQHSLFKPLAFPTFCFCECP